MPCIIEIVPRLTFQASFRIRIEILASYGIVSVCSKANSLSFPTVSQRRYHLHTFTPSEYSLCGSGYIDLYLSHISHIGQKYPHMSLILKEFGPMGSGAFSMYHYL